MERLKDWLNQQVRLSRVITEFEVAFANGYLLGELLARHALLKSMDGLVDKLTPAAKITNFALLHDSLVEHGIDFDTKMANAIMTERKGAAADLLASVKFHIEKSQGIALPRAPPRVWDGDSTRITRPAKTAPFERFAAMQAEFDTSLANADPVELPHLLVTAKFTKHMIAQQKENEEHEAEVTRQYWEQINATRDLHLNKIREGQRLMAEWQALAGVAAPPPTRPPPGADARCSVAARARLHTSGRTAAVLWLTTAPRPSAGGGVPQPREEPDTLPQGGRIEAALRARPTRETACEEAHGPLQAHQRAKRWH